MYSEENSTESTSTALANSVKKKWLNETEAEKYLGVGKTFFKSLREQGLLPFSLVGRRYFYLVDDIDQLLMNNRVK